MEASPKEGHGLVPPGAVSGRLLSMQPDAVLCKLCMRGSDDAFAVLHARYSQQVFAFVFHLLNRPGSVDDAEDLTQEILGKAFSNMSTRRDEGSFKAWLFRIARNHTFDHIRARRPSPASFDDPDFHEEPSNVISLQQEVEKRSEMDWLLAAMGRLPDRQREALVMRELGGMSYDEIGETLETTPEGVKQLIKRGRSNVSQAAEVSGYRSKSLKRDLGLAAPIVTIGWLGSGAGNASAAMATGSAAAATGGVAASGGAVAGGTGLALVGGKAAATVLAVVAVGTGGVVVGEQVVSERSASDTPAKSESSTNSGSSTAPAQSLTVGEKAAAIAKANKIAANKRRELAQERRARAKARAKAKRVAAAKRSEAAKSKAKSNSAGGRSNGTSKSTGSGNSSAGGGSSNSSSGGSKQATENNTGGSGSGAQGGSGQSTTPGSGSGSANSNAGGKSKE
jgi:RNA polymerase sigma factor (sigma-70 family)